MVDRHSGIYQETNGTGALMSHRCLPPTLSKMNAITVQNKCRHRTALFDHKQLPDNARPVVHSDRGCHYRWPGWLELMERYGLTRSMSAKGCSPDNAAAEGFFGRMKTESVYPEHWEKRTRDEVLVLIDEYIHWYNHERIKQSLGWMSPVQYRQSQGMAA